MPIALASNWLVQDTTLPVQFWRRERLRSFFSFR